MPNGDEKEVARVLSHHLNSHEYPSFQLSNCEVHDFFAEAKAFMRDDEAAFRLYESGSALERGEIMSAHMDSPSFRKAFERQAIAFTSTAIADRKISMDYVVGAKERNQSHAR